MLLRQGLETAGSNGRASITEVKPLVLSWGKCFLRGAYTSRRHSCGPAGPVCNSSYQQSLPISVLSTWYWLVRYKRCKTEVLVESSWGWHFVTGSESLQRGPEKTIVKWSLRCLTTETSGYWWQKNPGMAAADSCSVVCSWPKPKEKLCVLRVAELEELGYRGPLRP